MIRAVLDANVFVSALLRPDGPPGRILARLLEEPAFELVASASILRELRRALAYPKIRGRLDLSEAQLDDFVTDLGRLAIVVRAEPARRIVPADPDDDKYVAAAEEGLASYLVTGDRQLLALDPLGSLRIVPPQAFLALIAPPPG